jgi:hypothetical protein
MVKKIEKYLNANDFRDISDDVVITKIEKSQGQRKDGSTYDRYKFYVKPESGIEITLGGWIFDDFIQALLIAWGENEQDYVGKKVSITSIPGKNPEYSNWVISPAVTTEEVK